MPRKTTPAANGTHPQGLSFFTIRFCQLSSGPGSPRSSPTIRCLLIVAKAASAAT